jgi:hypothetical protein
MGTVIGALGQENLEVVATERDQNLARVAVLNNSTVANDSPVILGAVAVKHLHFRPGFSAVEASLEHEICGRSADGRRGPMQTCPRVVRA